MKNYYLIQVVFEERGKRYVYKSFFKIKKETCLQIRNSPAKVGDVHDPNISVNLAKKATKWIHSSEEYGVHPCSCGSTQVFIYSRTHQKCRTCKAKEEYLNELL